MSFSSVKGIISKLQASGEEVIYVWPQKEFAQVSKKPLTHYFYYILSTIYIIY